MSKFDYGIIQKFKANICGVEINDELEFNHLVWLIDVLECHCDAGSLKTEDKRRLVEVLCYLFNAYSDLDTFNEYESIIFKCITDFKDDIKKILFNDFTNKDTLKDFFIEKLNNLSWY